MSTKSLSVLSRSLRSDIYRILLLQGGTALFSLINQLVIARSLGPAGKGVVDFYLLLVYFVTEFGSLGLASGIVFVMTRMGVTPAVGNGLSVLFAILLGCVTGGIVYIYNIYYGLNIYATAALLAGIGAPFAIYRAYWGNVAIAIGQASLSYMAQFFFTFLLLLGILLLWLVQVKVMTANSVMLIMLLSIALVASLGAEHFRRRLGIGWDRSTAKQMFWYSMKMYPSHIANVFHYRLDQYVIAVYLGPSALGIYALSARLAETFWLLDQAMISASLLKITQLPKNESWALVCKIAGIVLLIGLVVAVLIYGIGEWAIFSVFGTNFAESGRVLLPLLIGAITWAVARVLAQFLGFRLEKPIYCTVGAMIAAVVNGLGLAVVFTIYRKPTLTAIGMVTMVSYIFIAILYYLFILKMLKEEKEVG